MGQGLAVCDTRLAQRATTAPLCGTKRRWQQQYCECRFWMALERTTAENLDGIQQEGGKVKSHEFVILVCGPA